MASKIFEDKTTAMPTSNDWPVRVAQVREEVDHMAVAVAGLPGQRAMQGVSVEHTPSKRRGHNY